VVEGPINTVVNSRQRHRKVQNYHSHLRHGHVYILILNSLLAWLRCS